jgi:Ca2+ transporting ATPase
METAYTKTPAQALKHFGVTEEKGLSEQQVQSLRAKHGKNGTHWRYMQGSVLVY